MSRVQVPSLTPRHRAPDLRKRRSGALSLPTCPPVGGRLGAGWGAVAGRLRCARGTRTVEPVNVPTQLQARPKHMDRDPRPPAPRLLAHRPGQPQEDLRALRQPRRGRALRRPRPPRRQPVGGAGVRARPPARDPAQAARHGATARARADPGPVRPAGASSTCSWDVRKDCSSREPCAAADTARWASWIHRRRSRDSSRRDGGMGLAVTGMPGSGWLGVTVTLQRVRPQRGGQAPPAVSGGACSGPDITVAAVVSPTRGTPERFTDQPRRTCL